MQQVTGKGLVCSTAYDGKLMRFREDYVVGLPPVITSGYYKHRTQETKAGDVFLLLNVEVFERHAVFNVMVNGELVTLASSFTIFDNRNSIKTKVQRLNDWILTVGEEIT